MFGSQIVILVYCIPPNPNNIVTKISKWM